MIDNIENAKGDKVVVLHPVIADREYNKENLEKLVREPEDALAEAVGLAMAIDLRVVHKEYVNVKLIRPATLIGQGVMQRMKEVIEAEKATLLFVDCNLSPVQQRNLEKECSVKVIDRTGLILEIFGARAKTSEGKLQVELAALEYQRSRLVRAWTHLERQRNTSSFVGGPGETQKELDRRMIDDRVKKIKQELEHVKHTRDIQRHARKREPFPIIALVGYTNAGKSTLFNYLTKSDVFSKDLLFATLDTTMRGLKMPSGKRAIFSDTVGFISGLPHHLVAAFRSTLEEVQDADVILHVRDVSQRNTEVEKQDVVKILGDLGINAATDNRIIDVLNKIDLIPLEDRTRVVNSSMRKDDVVAVSAITGEGIDELLRTIDVILCRNQTTLSVKVDITDGSAIAWLHKNGNIIDRKDDEEFIDFKLAMDHENVERFKSNFNYKIVLEDE